MSYLAYWQQALFPIGKIDQLYIEFVQKHSNRPFLNMDQNYQINGLLYDQPYLVKNMSLGQKYLLINIQMIKSQQYSELLQKLFNPSDNSLKIDLTILKQICQSQDYKRLIDVTSILFKLFLAGKQNLSVRELVGSSLYPALGTRDQAERRDRKIQFFVDALSIEELTAMIRQLQNVRKRMKHTIYSVKLATILEMLKKVLAQFKPQNDKKEEQFMIGDVEIMQEQYKKFLANSIFQNIFQTKMGQFLKNPKPYLQGKFTNSYTSTKFIAVEVMPHLEKSVLSIPLINHTERQGQITRILNFIHHYFIVQYQIQVQISKNTLVQTRIFHNKFQRELLFRSSRQIIRSLRKILNEAILCPSSMNIQILLLRIIRRLYLLWDYTSVHSNQNLESFRQQRNQVQQNIANIVRNPLFLVIRNISLFSQGRQQELKEAAMFTYKVIQDKNDLELVTLLENCDQLKFLRNSKFYSSKAFTFADEIEKIYDPAQLGSLYLKNYHIIAARQFWVYTFLIEKPSTLVFWQFYLSSYDIKFGVFKTEHLKELTLQQYEKGVECREVIRLEKVQNGSNNPFRGHLYLKNGIYRLVFDNSFSMIRSKELFYSFLHLQSHS